MKIDDLKNYVDSGREIEFKYSGKMYSITYGRLNNQDVISFCEFYKETSEVTSFDDLLKVVRNHVSVKKMWESLTEDDVWIY